MGCLGWTALVELLEDHLRLFHFTVMHGGCLICTAFLLLLVRLKVTCATIMSMHPLLDILVLQLIFLLPFLLFYLILELNVFELEMIDVLYEVNVGMILIGELSL